MAALGAASISGVPPFGLPKIKQLGGRHFQSHLFRFAAVVDEREQRHSFGLQNGLQLVDRLVHGVMARNFDDPFLFLHGKRLRRE